LINDLLDLAKIEAKHFPLEKTWFAVDEVLQNTLKGLSGLAQQSQVSFDVMVSSSFEVYADKDRVQQVLTNLLSNAVKYSPAQGVVRLEVHANENNQLLMAVYDQGPGISPEDKEMIFEKFQQATTAKTPLVKGTGLGLAIAKALVAEHNGEIGVRSNAGEGSCFFFSLPEWRPFEKLPQPKTEQLEVLEQEAA
jgi:signal transduction histidine kinase